MQLSNFADIVKPLEMSAGMFFITEFSARGGTTYTRVGPEHTETREDLSLTAEFSTRKEVDHIGLVKWSKQIITQAYLTMERHSSQTPAGYWVPTAKVDVILTELKGIQGEAKKLNEYAKSVRSLRRVNIEVYMMQVGRECLELTAKRLAQTVRERLESLREDLLAANLNSYSASWARAKNLPQLATGIQAESIVLALEAARELRADVAAKLKQGKKPEDIGATLDTMAIDSAIVLFTDSVNGSLAVVDDPNA